MHAHSSRLHRLPVALGALAFLSVLGTGEYPAQGGKPAAEPLPESVTKAWRDGGAEVGWIRVGHPTKHFAVGRLGFKSEKNGLSGDVPAFQFAEWKAGVFPRLPMPVRPFGLSLHDITDTGLRELGAFKNLTVLDLFYAPVTDTGVKELAGLENLTQLDLGLTRVTNTGMKQLAGLTKLTRLYLEYTSVADAGLRELAGLKNLSTLYLTSTDVTDAGLKELASLKNLKALGLGITKVTDEGLKELVGLDSLIMLDIHNTEVTDAGLKELFGLKDLTLLFLPKQVTDVGLKELRKKLPNCVISR